MANIGILGGSLKLSRRIAAICWLQRSSSADLGWTASF